MFAKSGMIGTLILLVAYVLATIGAMRLLFFSGDTTTRRWEIVIPLLALVVLGYTIYRNVVPYPTGRPAGTRRSAPCGCSPRCCWCSPGRRSRAGPGSG